MMARLATMTLRKSRRADNARQEIEKSSGNTDASTDKQQTDSAVAQDSGNSSPAPAAAENVMSGAVAEPGNAIDNNTASAEQQSPSPAESPVASPADTSVTTPVATNVL